MILVIATNKRKALAVENPGIMRHSTMVLRSSTENCKKWFRQRSSEDI
jgi:hypothetical protein